ncbi:helix-turn-helix domain-containing protein [Oceanospirillum sediminis]|uniref:Helix-turn-helix transcriptional regulator n=1 Tax=Oceanospirillum sediminis TaxID=2760088 RepID=A0A839IK32_9GAMM|nr:AraC family transcriptional regulator [Oceanospirillum sediminis]MBB1485261.1 helix-turn-helix transcriptional regulator [Oceanospirillum sediminis]
MNTAIRVNHLPNNCLSHDHEYHQLVIGLSGRAEFEIEGSCGQVSPVKGCLVPSEHTHFYEGIGSNTHLIIDLPRQHPLLEGRMTALNRLFDSPGYFNIDNNLKLFLSFMLKEIDAFGNDPSTSDFLSFALMHRLHERIFRQLPPLQPTDRLTLNIDRINHYIRQNMSDKITVAQLARIACISESRFHLLFRETIGLTPHQYLIQARLKEAYHLLYNSSVSVNDIAAQTGFTSQSALTNAFKKYYQTTPGQIRRQH